MNSIKACVIVIVLTVSLSSARAQSASANFDLVSADWSAKQAKTLNALPKSAIWNFVSGPFRDDSPAHVCDFRFADLRHLGTLSLVAVIDVSGRGFCSSMEIFDRTDKAASGFVESSSPADLLGDLRDAIQDIGHDGNLELVLDGSLAESETHELDCFPEWPVIVAWTGSNYTDVSSQYKGYYERYLSSLNSQLAAKSSDNGSAATPASVSTPEVAPASPSLEVGASDASFGGGFGAGKPSKLQIAYNLANTLYGTYKPTPAALTSCQLEEMALELYGPSAGRTTSSQYYIPKCSGTRNGTTCSVQWQWEINPVNPCGVCYVASVRGMIPKAAPPSQATPCTGASPLPDPPTATTPYSRKLTWGAECQAKCKVTIN